jgi:hypothetical protein
MQRSLSATAAVLWLTIFTAPALAQIDAPADKPAAEPPTRKRPDNDIGRLLNALEEAGKTRAFDDEWALRLKAVIDYGPKGVPELIKELDATPSDMMQRCLGFSLRAIGDKRAVPALIRAFPKTLRPPGSDMGCRAKDKELNAFMQKHDLDPDDRDDHYGFGRPVREIGGALTALTGVKQNEEELYSIFLDGGPTSQRQQRRLFEQCASRWADWWNAHGKELVGDDFTPVEIKVTPATTADSFPFGEAIKIGGGHSGHVLQPDTHADARAVFLDLDTGRSAPLPPVLRTLSAGRERDDEIQAWAAREGFDLMGIEQKSDDARRTHYYLRGLGLSAWPIPVERWEMLEKDLKEPNPPLLDQAVGGLLAARDAKTGALRPEETAAFLFRTREGTYGALFVGVEVHDTNVVIGKALEGDPNVDPVAFYRGRRFGYKRIDEGKE